MKLQDKTILITGLASKRSIAYGIASRAHAHGAKLIFTYQNDKLKSRVEEFAEEFGAIETIECDVSIEEHVEELGHKIRYQYDLHGLVHSIAYAPADQLQGDYLHHMTKEGFRIAHEISSYSLGSLVKALHEPLTKAQGSVVSLTYLGSERFVPNYNVMGLAKASLEANVRYLAASLGRDQVRVNAISAGPIKTLAASGIKGFKDMLEKDAEQNLLKRNVDIEEIGEIASFLLSKESSCITGQILYADCGYSVTGGF